MFQCNISSQTVIELLVNNTVRQQSVTQQCYARVNFRCTVTVLCIHKLYFTNSIFLSVDSLLSLNLKHWQVQAYDDIRLKHIRAHTNKLTKVIMSSYNGGSFQVTKLSLGRAVGYHSNSSEWTENRALQQETQQ